MSEKEEKPEVAPRPVPKNKVVFSETIGNVKLIEFEGVEKCNGAVVLEGVPSHGLTSIVASNFITEQLELPVVGCFSCEEFPPRALVQDGTPTHAARLLGNEHIVVFLCEFPIPKGSIGSIVKLCYSFCERHKAKLFITIEGLPQSEVQTDTSKKSKTPHSQLHMISSCPTTFAQLEKFGAKPISHGIIDGITGGILSRCSYAETPVLALLAEMPKFDTGATAAAAIVCGLDEILDVYIDTSPLEKKAVALSEKVKALQSNGSPIRNHSMYT